MIPVSTNPDRITESDVVKSERSTYTKPPCSCKKVWADFKRWCVCCLAATGCLCFFCGHSATAHAKPPSTSTQNPVSTAITPPKLLKQAQLQYPDAAISSRQHGTVQLLVQVDVDGKVIDAQIESGPEVFRAISLQTALQLEFSPAIRNGSPVAATTRVSFHFAPTKGEAAGKAHDTGANIVVHSTNPDHEDTRARTTLTQETLEQSAGEDFAQSVSQVAGVRIAGGASDTSKPIIRGQQERRLLVLNDGIRHESQKWGPDHGTEIDPFSAGSISVIRGAASARYGPDAIGGVILVEPPPMRTEPGVVGRFLSSYDSNGNRPYTAVRIDSGSNSGFSSRLEANGAIGSTQSAPNYLLGNTASQVWNVGGALAKKWDGGNIRASWHHHDFKAGVFYGLNHNTPDEFIAQFHVDRPVTADVWESTYEIDRPYQAVTHDIAVLSTDLDGEWGDLEVTYAFQINLRDEYEHVRGDNPWPQYDFTLRTHSIDSVYEHPTASYAVGKLTGGVGIQGSFQENVYQGFSLIPNFRSFSGGLFVYERLAMDRFDLEVGARLDTLARNTYIRDNDYDAYVRRGTLDTSTCEEREQTARCPAEYTASSISVGGLFHVIPKHVDLKLDLSTATRFPNVDELYMLGYAPTFPVYANGFPDLQTETVYNASFTAGMRTTAIEAEASVYGQRVDDYIYFAPELNADGQPRFDVTIRGTWPTYSFRPIDADFYGADGSVDLAPQAPVGLQAVGGIVRATNRNTGDELIGTPADHLTLKAIGRTPPMGKVKKLEFHVQTDLVAEQSRVNPEQDIAPPPDGYTLLGVGLDTEIGPRRPIRLGVDVTNLLNTSYREYTSLLRYYGDQPGRNVRVRVGMDF